MLKKNIFISFLLIYFTIFSLKIIAQKKKEKNVVEDYVFSVALKNYFKADRNLKHYRDTLIKLYEKKFNETLHKINSLRNPFYQYRVYLEAKKLEGKNIYHNYSRGNKNAEDNTCVNGWCQVMSATGVSGLKELTTGRINYYPETLQLERSKGTKANLNQKTPKYINVNKLLNKVESLGFLAIDLDLAQRGDFCIQYYKKKRLNRKEEFAAQHISIIDAVNSWGEGIYELRDWHEGIEGEPFTYRTGTNMKSSFNNIFHPINIYYGYEVNQGKPRHLYTKNPNVCQAYGYFGYNVSKAKPLIKKLNKIRGELTALRKTPNGLDFLDVYLEKLLKY